MTRSAIEHNVPTATNAVVTDDTLSVDLSDGRTISVLSHGIRVSFTRIMRNAPPGA